MSRGDGGGLTPRLSMVGGAYVFSGSASALPSSSTSMSIVEAGIQPLNENMGLGDGAGSGVRRGER